MFACKFGFDWMKAFSIAHLVLWHTAGALEDMLSKTGHQLLIKNDKQGRN